MWGLGCSVQRAVCRSTRRLIARPMRTTNRISNGALVAITNLWMVSTITKGLFCCGEKCVSVCAYVGKKTLVITCQVITSVFLTYRENMYPVSGFLFLINDLSLKKHLLSLVIRNKEKSFMENKNPETRYIFYSPSLWNTHYRLLTTSIIYNSSRMSQLIPKKQGTYFIHLLFEIPTIGWE